LLENVVILSEAKELLLHFRPPKSRAAMSQGYTRIVGKRFDRVN